MIRANVLRWRASWFVNSEFGHLNSCQETLHVHVLARLEKLEGAAFDCAYVHDQVKDHEKTIALFEREAAGGKDAGRQPFRLPAQRLRSQDAVRDAWDRLTGNRAKGAGR